MTSSYISHTLRLIKIFLQQHPLQYSQVRRYREERCAKFLGHFLRSSDVDSLRQASFTPSSASGIDYGKKRVGWPRPSWVMFSQKYVLECRLQVPSYTETAEQDQRVYDAALQRQFSYQGFD